jgi:hypothetical protein
VNYAGAGSAWFEMRPVWVPGQGLRPSKLASVLLVFVDSLAEYRRFQAAYQNGRISVADQRNDDTDPDELQALIDNTCVRSSQNAAPKRTPKAASSYSRVV